MRKKEPCPRGAGRKTGALEEETPCCFAPIPRSGRWGWFFNGLTDHGFYRRRMPGLFAATSDMKKIYSSHDGLIINHLRNLLESIDIRCQVKNEVLAGAAGELPPTECWPELWVVESTQAAKAEAAIKAALSTDESAGPAWSCPECGERIESQFTQCWQCGAIQR